MPISSKWQVHCPFASRYATCRHYLSYSAIQTEKLYYCYGLLSGSRRAKTIEHLHKKWRQNGTCPLFHCSRNREVRAKSICAEVTVSKFIDFTLSRQNVYAGIVFS